MKTNRTLLLSIFFLMAINTISAQYGNNGYGNGYGNNGYGNNGYGRSGGINQESQQEKPREIPVDETVGKIVGKLKKEINLDELQEIAISNVFKESLREQAIILKHDTNDEDKIRDIQALSETTDRKIMDFLNKEQKTKYITLTEDRKNQRQSKRQR